MDNQKLKDWAREIGIDKIKCDIETDKIGWAIRTISQESHKISSMSTEDLCDLLMALNGWHLYLRKQISREKAQQCIKASTESKIKIDSMYEICRSLVLQIDSLKTVYNNRCWEKRYNASSSR